jgi:hypothetical protein
VNCGQSGHKSMQCPFVIGNVSGRGGR